MKKPFLISGVVALFALAGGGAWWYSRPAPGGAARLPFEQAVIQNDMLRAADAKTGAAHSTICAACHSFTKGGPNAVGPNLFGIVGARVASREGYEYSDALKKLNELHWTTDELYDYLKDPSAYAPGTKMSYTGIVDPQDRADMIAYLMTLR